MKSFSFIIIISRILAFINRLLLRTRYRVSVKGLENIPVNAPVLYLPNHQALIDPLILISNIFRVSAATPVISARYYNIPIAKWYFKRIGAVSVNDLEKGSRDILVLKSITRAVYKGLRRKKSFLIYPGGQLTAQGYEKIYNKKSAHKIVSKIPEDVHIFGVRISGLWGSMWSKAKNGKTPDFFIQMLKGIFYVIANLLFFVPKRNVTIEFEDISDTARKQASEGLKNFNDFLEDFYNLRGEEPALFKKYFFYFPQSSLPKEHK